MNQEDLEAKKKRYQFLIEQTLEAKRQAAKLEQKANQYEREIYEEENKRIVIKE